MALNLNPIVLTPTQFVATGTPAVLYTAPSSNINGVIIKKASFANVTIAGVLLTLYRVPQGGSVASSNEVTPGVTVANASAPYIAQELTNLILAPGDSIWAVAGSSSAITATMSGFIF